MSNVEQLDLSVKLSSSFWKDPPKTKVFLDEHLIFDGIINEPIEIKWSGNLVEGQHKLIIELYDKTKYQTVIEDDKIIKDQLLNIDVIRFDDIDLGYLKQSLSKYYPDQTIHKGSPLLENNCINLGWNGRWELEFTTPVYIWLLENL